MKTHAGVAQKMFETLSKKISISMLSQLRDKAFRFNRKEVFRAC